MQRCETTGAVKDFSSASLSLIWEGRRKLSRSCSQHVKQSKGCWAPPFNSDLLPYRLFHSLIRDPTGTAEVMVVKDSPWEVTLGTDEFCVLDKADLGIAAAWPFHAAGIRAGTHHARLSQHTQKGPQQKCLPVRNSRKKEVTIIISSAFWPSKLLLNDSLQHLLTQIKKANFSLSCSCPMQAQLTWDKVCRCSHVFLGGHKECQSQQPHIPGSLLGRKK